MLLDLIITSARIETLDPNRPVAHKVGVLHGRIVGFDEELLDTEALESIDFGDACVTPGLIDAHCHTAWWGLGLSALDVSKVRGLEELYALLEIEARRLDARGDEHAWLHATGFNQGHHGGAFPSIERLDDITGRRPLYIRHTSGHASLTNSATLQLIGALDPQFENPVGGVVVRDGEGNPTGLVEESAQGLIQAMLLPYSVDTLVDALDAATQRFAAQGITSFTEAGVGGGWIGHSPIEVAAYQKAAATGRLHARAQLMPALDALRESHGHANDHGGVGTGLGLDLGIGFGFGNDWLQFGHVKVFLDGSLLGATAAATEAFCNHERSHGYLLNDPDVFRERVLAAYRAGWPLALHAIGDAAIDVALELIDEAQTTYGQLEVGCRIEHFGMARDDQLERAAALGVAVTPQAGFIGPLGDQMAAMVGPDRTPWLYRGRSIIDAGIVLTGSSDLPVADNNLRRGMQSAVDRLTDGGKVLNAAEAITPLEALRSHTEWAAQATGRIADVGTLEPGKLADFTVFSDSPTQSSDIAALEIVATFVGGRATFGEAVTVSSTTDS